MHGAQHWTPVSVRLSYRLGDIGLFHKKFSGLANREHFSKCQPFADVPNLDGCFETPPRFVYFPTYPIRNAPPPIVTRDRWIAYTPYTFKNYYIDFERLESFDNYLHSAFSSKSRSTLQRKVRKFAEADGGQVHWRQFKVLGEIDEFFAQARSVSTKTYQERLLDAGIPTSAEFIARAKEMAEADRALCYILYLRSEPVAYLLCFCHDGIASYDFLGYDPAAQALSPGTVLHYFVLQSLFDEKTVRLFDFTEGEGRHKAFFGSDHRLCAKTYFFRRTLLNHALVHAHYRLNRVVEAIGERLERHGLKTRIKRFIRKVA